MAKLATKYPKLYSVSFSLGKYDDEEITFSAVELARKFSHAPFQTMRNSSFIVTYPIGYCSTDRDISNWFKYSSHHSNKISISLKPSWYNQSFVGFVVCFILKSCDVIWESCPDGRPFRYGEVIAQLVHKDNAANEQVLKVGRQCDEEFDDVFEDIDIICFAYIPFLSLFNNKSRDTPSDYLVFEVAFRDPASNASTDWSCGLLYSNDESLSEAICSKTIASSHDNGDSEQINEEAPLSKETPVSTQHEQVVRNQTESFAESFKRHEEVNTEKEKVKRWKEALKKAGGISGYHLQNDFNGFEAKCVETVTHDIFTRVNYRSIQASSSVLKDNFVGLETRVGYVGKLLTQEPDDVQFIGILGMGGIGKTTIAMAVFDKFSSQFDGACYLDDVKEHKITELQETLLGRILNKKMRISNELDGMVKIRGGLGRKKVLIVLDDIDQVEQLQKLAGCRGWFGTGSRVIITTRDAAVLRSHRIDVRYLYGVDTLEEQKAIQLFSCYAFKSEIPATGFQRLSELIAHYCKGLPLALKILGSSLCGLEVAEWENTLEQLKDIPDNDICGKLKIISFDRLDSINKKIFLHIACFFRHHKEKHVKEALNGLQLGFIGMRVLIEKSLISVSEFGRIEMHDLIQDMGWHIARQENPRSRVWELKEVDDVLCGKMDPKHIECIVFPYTCGFRWQNISNAFEVLKILIGKRSWSYNEKEDNNFDRDVMDNFQFPSSLELIHFPDYPFPLLPTSLHHPCGMDDNPLELAAISSHCCSLENFRITEKLNKLTYLNLSSSRSLLETPNFVMMPNLKELYLSGCEKLVEIHSSVGYLKKLVLLDLSYCRNLKKLPRFIQVSTLQFLKFEYCSKLGKFPEIQANMPLVLQLNLESIRIRELPSSIGRLRGLTKLRLFRCEDLVSLSDDLCELESLKILELRYCLGLESLPEKLGNLSKLEELHVFDTAIFQLPSSITQLSSLECLCWGGNLMFKKDRIKFLPSVSGLCSLKMLQLSNFKSIHEGLPSDLGRCLISLEYLNLNGSNFGYLPESFSQLPYLQYLNITHCEELEKLPELPATIRELYANSNLASESNMTKLATKYPKLYSISFPHRDKRITFSAVELARKFAHAPFQIMRNSSFIVTYPIGYCSTDRDITKWFKYSSHHSNKISITLKSSWHNQSFLGFVVCFILKSCDGIWKSCQEGRPFRYGQVKAQLVHKDNAANEEVLQTNCDFGRLCDDVSDGIICFAYIPFLSLFNNKSRDTPSDYLVFEVAFRDPASNASTDWSCGLLYQNDESLSEAIWSKTTSHHNADSGHFDDEETSIAENSVIHAAWSKDQPDFAQPNPIIGEEIQSDHNYHNHNEEDYETTALQQELGPDRTKLWELTKIVDLVQCQMVSMPECSDAKVVRLLYTNSGAGILALNSDGIQKLWKWSYNEQNPSRKNWQANSGPPMINDVPAINLEEVVPCIALSNDDSYVVSAAGGKVSLFNIMTSEVTKIITSLSSASTFLAFVPHDNNIIAIGTQESSIYIYDWVNEELIKLREHQKHITGLAFSAKLKMLVSADADAQLCVWSTSLWKMRRSVHIQLPDGEVPSGGDTRVMFHADQLHLLVTHETQLAIYDASKMELIHQCIPHASLSARISSATYSCNSQLIYASFIDGNIGVFDADTLTLKCRIVPSAYLPQPLLNGSEDVYPLVIAAHPQEPNQFAIGLTDGSIKVIEPLESQGNCEVSVSSPVDNGKKNGRLVWQVLRRTLATMCLGLFGVGIIRIIQTKTRKSKMKFDRYIRDGSGTNRSDRAEQGKPNQPQD